MESLFYVSRGKTREGDTGKKNYRNREWIQHAAVLQVAPAYGCCQSTNGQRNEATSEVEAQGGTPKPDPEAVRKADNLAEQPGSNLLRYHSLEEIQEAKTVYTKQPPA
jgi:hypothetical protein